MTKKILIAEDDEALRLMICDVLENEGYETFGVSNGAEGLDFLGNQSVDLVLSDINMPLLNGFDFLKSVEELYPGIHRVLMTAYNVDDYMQLIQEYNIGNIVTKGLPFNTPELLLTCEQLLSRDIFGLHQHMKKDSTIQCDSIKSPEEIEKLSNHLAELYGNEANTRKLRTVLVELLTNALFYGAKDEKGADKANWEKDFKLNPAESIKVCHGFDGEKVGFSILDFGGKLDQKTILYWLNRQLTPGENGLPTGLFDTHGRGLYITRQYVDRLIVNVERTKKCECIILNYLENPPTTYKPVRINEI